MYTSLFSALSAPISPISYGTATTSENAAISCSAITGQYGKFSLWIMIEVCNCV
jgi:hypothetical protein